MRKLRKSEGSFLDGVAMPLISIIALAAMLVVFITSTNDANASFKIKEVSRRYILKIESKGYLNSTDENNLRKDLSDIGIYDINLEGTTKNKGEYGEEVYLYIKGKYNIEQYAMRGLRLEKRKSAKNIEEIQKSTGKH